MRISVTLPSASRARDRLVQRDLQGGAIGQSRQGVVAGGMAEPLLRRLALRDVRGDADQTARTAVAPMSMALDSSQISRPSVWR